MYICITKSLYCSLKLSTTLFVSQLYPNTKSKKKKKTEQDPKKLIFKFYLLKIRVCSLTDNMHLP